MNYLNIKFTLYVNTVSNAVLITCGYSSSFLVFQDRLWTVNVKKLQFVQLETI